MRNKVLIFLLKLKYHDHIKLINSGRQQENKKLKIIKLLKRIFKDSEVVKFMFILNIRNLKGKI